MIEAWPREGRLLLHQTDKGSDTMTFQFDTVLDSSDPAKFRPTKRRLAAFATAPLSDYSTQEDVYQVRRHGSLLPSYFLFSQLLSPLVSMSVYQHCAMHGSGITLQSLRTGKLGAGRVTACWALILQLALP